MDNLIKDISFLVAGIGVLASGAGYLFRQYNEDRRVARTVLYYLLEIWNVCIARSMPAQQLVDGILNEYNEAVVEVLGVEAAIQLDLKDGNREAVAYSILVQHCIGTLPKLSDDVIRSYLLCLEKLSERFPIISYRIAGREKIQDILRAVEEYENQINLAFSKELMQSEAAEVIRSAQMLARNSIAKQFVEDVENDVLRVAWKAGIGNWIRCIFIVRGREKLRKKAMRELRNEFAELLRQLLSVKLGSDFQGENEAEKY
jgi:hypothetical protein